MADRRFDSKNNYKKTSSVFGSVAMTLTVGDLNDTLFTLPKASLVTKVYAIVITAGAANAAVDVKVGTTTVASNKIDTVGTNAIDANKYFETGGNVTISGTLTAVAKIRLVIEYIELNLTSGEATD